MNNPNPFLQWACASYSDDAPGPASRVAHILRTCEDEFPRKADPDEMYRWFTDQGLAYDTIEAYEQLYEAWKAEFGA